MKGADMTLYGQSYPAPEGATHHLMCRHAIGKNGYWYLMYCRPIKIMSDGRMKVLVFGDRLHSSEADQSKTRIRYVDAHRIREFSDFRE